MIELNKKTQHDFLNRKWVQRLLDAGVDMSDAKYYIYTNPDNEKDYIGYKEQMDIKYALNCIPTYTVSELLYKLHEWIYPIIDGVEYSGPLTFLKDAPFYCFFYSLKSDIDPETRKIKLKQEYVSAGFDNPIESLASVLLQCHQKDIGLEHKDTGNIQDKYNQ